MSSSRRRSGRRQSRPWRCRDCRRRDRRLLELIERNAQSPGVGVRCEPAEELELAERRADLAPRGSRAAPVCFAIAIAAISGKGCHHRSRPAPAVGRQLLAPAEGGARKIPRGDVHQPAEAGEARVNSCRGLGPLQMRAQLPGERVRGAAGSAPAALFPPPFQTRVRHVMIDAGPQARADLPLDAAERREHRLLGS